MTSFELHRAAKQGEIERVRELLSAQGVGINARDHSGRTPLMHAVESPKATPELVRLLLDGGADLHEELPAHGLRYNIVSLCLSAGDPAKLQILLEHGAELHYQRPHDYGAFIDATTGRDVERNPRLLDLLRILIEHGVNLHTVTSYDESPLRVLSGRGRFDAVAFLLAAGADESLLKWTPVIRAVAVGSLDDVRAAIGRGTDLEQTDHRSRTAWLVAVQTGDVAKASFLVDRGAATRACGHCGHPSLHYAIENYHSPMLEWLLQLSAPTDQTDDFETTPLMAAVGCGNLEAVDILLKAGADLRPEKNGTTALGLARSREIVTRLLDSGADPSELSFEGRRALLGFDPDPDELLFDVSPIHFQKARSPRQGESNPEPMDEPFWIAMIRAGINASQAEHRFGERRYDSPVWCAQRFGQSLTRLPDGRIIQIAGEHEDYYDPDFCIYNDVFAHEPNGAIHIFGYPETVFPPTDFHTATLLDQHIYIIGSLGYQGTRQYGITPVYRLHTGTFGMEKLEVSGESPGWISEHRAVVAGPEQIRVFGGRVITTADDGTDRPSENKRAFILDTKNLSWRLADNAV